jgi:SAM-dependent methyltransferase
MPIFDEYARYYDLFYRDKDYPAEAAFVLDRLAANGCERSSLLDLGCGTGRHCLEFSRTVGRVAGVDASLAMVSRAMEQCPPDSPRLRFTRADIREVRLGERFDAVVSLFHVFSYQTSNEDLARAFETAAAHLQPGGLLLFDFWYGPAVLASPPETRIRAIAAGDEEVLRIAEPRMQHESDTVDIGYKIIVKNRVTSICRDFEETHRMRYLFKPELELFARAAGLAVVEFAPWLRPAPVGLGDWLVYAVAKKCP